MYYEKYPISIMIRRCFKGATNLGRSFFLFYLQNVDTAPLEAVFDNVDDPQPIDRNGLLCNNVFKFAPNVFTIYLTRDLSVD